MEIFNLPSVADLEEGFNAQEAENYVKSLRPKEIPPEEPLPPPPPKQYLVFCPQCGLNFKYEKAGMATMQMRRHQKKAHPHAVQSQ